MTSVMMKKRTRKTKCEHVGWGKKVRQTREQLTCLCFSNTSKTLGAAVECDHKTGNKRVVIIHADE